MGSGPKTWLKSWGCDHITEQKSPSTLEYHDVGASKVFSMHAFPYHGSVLGLIGLKTQWEPWVSYLWFWDGSWESCCWCGRFVWCVFISPTSLMWIRRLNHIIVTSGHMFTAVGWLLGYMWEEDVIEWYESMVHPLDSMGDVLVIYWWQLHICFLFVYYMCLLHLYGVDHGCSDFDMWRLMALLWDVLLWMYSCICICYACLCLYVVMHSFSWLRLCLYARLDMHCELFVCN